MATTTIPAVKTAILALLQAASGLEGIQVEWGRPSKDAMRQESVWFDGTTSTQRAEAIGNQRRDETYIIELVVSVALDGDEAQACELRMWAIVAAIETVIRQHPKPIPAPLFDVQFAGADHRPMQAEGQRISEALVRLAARSRI